MATLAKPLHYASASDHQAELNRLFDKLFILFESHLATATPERKAALIADVHVTAESLRAKQ